MKRMILNLACAISLVAFGFSFWVITSPVTVGAVGGAKAVCQGGGSVTCQASGGSCDSHDPTPESKRMVRMRRRWRTGGLQVMQ